MSLIALKNNDIYKAVSIQVLVICTFMNTDIYTVYHIITYIIFYKKVQLLQGRKDLGSNSISYVFSLINNVIFKRHMWRQEVVSSMGLYPESN